MATVGYSPRARADLLRLADFLAGEDPGWALETATLITGAVEVLEAHPLIGHPVPGSSMRALVIARGRSGYLALYEYEPAADVVVVHSLRHQREAGFDGD